MTFNQYGIEERKLIQQVFSKVKGTQIDYIITPPNSKTVYDAILTIDGKSYLYEAKCRSTHYDTLMLEQKKYNNLMDLYKKDRYDGVFYLCSTPNGIYQINISKLNNINWIEEEHWKTNVDRSQGKIKKTLTYLDISLFKKLK
jgi:hypothetical protein